MNEIRNESGFVVFVADRRLSALSVLDWVADQKSGGVA